MPATEVVIAAIKCLTSREAEAVLWVAQGKTSWEAGQILGITSRTMDVHVAHASEKLHASNRAHLVAMAFVHGILAVAPRACCLMLSLAMSLLADDAVRPRHRMPPAKRRDDSWQASSAADGDMPRRWADRRVVLVT